MHPDGLLIKHLYEAFAGADLETIQNAIAEDAVLYADGEGPVAGTFKGRDEILGYFGELISRSSGSFKTVVHDILANDDHVVVLSNSSAERDGKRLDTQGIEIFHVKDGKIAEAYFTGMNTKAFDEFFS